MRKLALGVLVLALVAGLAVVTVLKPWDDDAREGERAGRSGEADAGDEPAPDRHRRSYRIRDARTMVEGEDLVLLPSLDGRRHVRNGIWRLVRMKD